VITVRSETRNQRGEILQTLVAKLVVPRRLSAESRAGDDPRSG
jgi:hypothetical protein